MATSEARKIASRLNGAKSKGSVSAEGRSHSRENSYKHGMAGSGVVLSGPEAAEIERRRLALAADLEPRTEAGMILIGQMALLSFRMETGAEHELACNASRARNASAAFDMDRLEKAEALLDGIALEPKKALRRLRRTPEGVDLMIEEWRDLLGRVTRTSWRKPQMVRAANLLGVLEADAEHSEMGDLYNVSWGEFPRHPDLDPEVKDTQAKRTWGRARLAERIGEIIAELEAHRATLDHGAIAQDRAEAGSRARFDPSKDATLARRYESEARRGFFKAYQEFRNAEGEATAVEAAESAPTSAPEVAPSGESSGSFREQPAPKVREPKPAPDRAANHPERAAEHPARPLIDANSQPLPIGSPPGGGR